MTAPEIGPDQVGEIYQAGYEACRRKMAADVTQAFDIGCTVGRARAEREQPDPDQPDQWWAGYNAAVKDMTDPVGPHRHQYRLTRRRTHRPRPTR